MKKYVKPELIYEHFELSQQIAACDFKGNAQGGYEGVDKDWGKVVIFMDPNNGCKTVAESYCYHNSSSGYYGIFNS